MKAASVKVRHAYESRLRTIERPSLAYEPVRRGVEGKGCVQSSLSDADAVIARERWSGGLDGSHCSSSHLQGRTGLHARASWMERKGPAPARVP
jgi:hypothetical protein